MFFRKNADSQTHLSKKVLRWFIFNICVHILHTMGIFCYNANLMSHWHKIHKHPRLWQFTTSANFITTNITGRKSYKQPVLINMAGKIMTYFLLHKSWSKSNNVETLWSWNLEHMKQKLLIWQQKANLKLFSSPTLRTSTQSFTEHNHLSDLGDSQTHWFDLIDLKVEERCGWVGLALALFLS